MSIRTIRCKLYSNTSLAQDFQTTADVFAEACNYVLQVALDSQTKNPFKLHQLTYRILREKWGLSANLAVRAIRRVSSAFGKRKRPRRFRPASVDYDARLFSFRERDFSISLKTMRGRKRVFLDIGDYQKRALMGKKPTAAFLLRRGKEWYLNICIEEETISFAGEGIMGIDLGICQIAYVNTGLHFRGDERQVFKQKCARVRASLQSKNTRRARERLKKLSGYEKRRIRHENHVLSKELVEEAKRHNIGTIRMEQLKAIRAKTKVWDKHRNRMMSGWSFYQLQQFVTYKAQAVGISVELVNPAYTSQTCHLCGCKGERKKEIFRCTTCGEIHADLNAAWVIAKGGAFVNRPELTV